MTTISKTAAIKLARIVVGDIIRCSPTEYLFCAPYYFTQPNGPRCDVRSGEYSQARRMRSSRMAVIAAYAMTGDSDIAMHAGNVVDNDCDRPSWLDVIDNVAKERRDGN